MQAVFSRLSSVKWNLGGFDTFEPTQYWHIADPGCKTGMSFFRNFHDLRGHSCGNRRSDLIFMGGGGGGYHIFCVLADRQQCWNGTP